MTRWFCSRCDDLLEPVAGHPDNYFCRRCTLWYKTSYAELSIPFVRPPWDNSPREQVNFVPARTYQLNVASQQGTQRLAVDEEELTPAQEKWLMDTANAFTPDLNIAKGLYKLMRRAFTGELEFMDMAQRLRAETGWHIHKIFELMRKTFAENPEAQREVAEEGVTLPFMLQVPQSGQRGQFQPRQKGRPKKGLTVEL